jgi:hypothetical protein
MTLSSSNLNEIGNLYESIAASEQEQLNEFGINPGGQAALAAKQAQMKSDAKFSSKLDAMRAQRFGGSNNSKPAANAPAKYKSSSDGKMYANYNDALAARNSRLKAAASTPTGSTKPAPTGAPTKPASSTPTPAKTLPSKPTIGTTAGGTKFERRTPTRQEMDAAKGAGGGEAGVKAAVAVSKPAATSTLSAATAAASKPPAFKPATASQATSAAPSTSAAASGGNAVTTANKIAAASKPVTVKASYEYDVYDLVLEYLLDNGHVDTVEEANYVMMEMDAETIGNIVEARMDPRGRPASGPMNVYANPKKPSKEHSDAVKAYDEKQKKKTPEQKKKELDDYIQRQRENK